MFTIEQSGAFRETFELEPRASGILDGLTFAVKDLIDVAGRKTGCGNPTWLETHPPATVDAVCVELLRAAGARCIGKTITDELAFSLIGENFFYGTPLNPRAPDRVCGGSSSGSASAVACGLVDFALGTDTGGSVRVPAANCGIWGFRPTHSGVSLAGVNPLSPSLDTIGILAASAETLVKSMTVLLSLNPPPDEKPSTIHVVREAFALCDREVSAALEEPMQKLRSAFGRTIRKMSIREIDDDPDSKDLMNWFEIYRVLQRVEAESCLGPWVASAKPQLGPIIAESFELTRNQDRSLISSIGRRREEYFHRMKAFLGKRDLLCIPTAPAPAPLKGTIKKREQAAAGYYPRALSLTSIAGVTRSPQIAFPAGDVAGAPVGLSLIARTGEDAFLLSLAAKL